jgi:hypothetical protein
MNPWCCVPRKIFPKSKSYQIVPGLTELPGLPELAPVAHKSWSFFPSIVSITSSHNNLQYEIEAMEAAARDMMQQHMVEPPVERKHTVKFALMPTLFSFKRHKSSEHDIVGNG